MRPNDGVMRKAYNTAHKYGGLSDARRVVRYDWKTKQYGLQELKHYCTRTAAKEYHDKTTLT